MLTPSRHLPQFARYLMSGGVATSLLHHPSLALSEPFPLAPPPAGAVRGAGGALASKANTRFSFVTHRTTLPPPLPSFSLGVKLGRPLDGWPPPAATLIYEMT